MYYIAAMVDRPTRKPNLEREAEYQQEQVFLGLVVNTPKLYSHNPNYIFTKFTLEFEKDSQIRRRTVKAIGEEVAAYTISNISQGQLVDVTGKIFTRVTIKA